MLLHAQICELSPSEVHQRLRRGMRAEVILEMALRFAQHTRTVQFTVVYHFAEDDYNYFTGTTCEGHALTIHISELGVVSVNIYTD